MLTNKLNLPKPIYDAFDKTIVWKPVIGYEDLYEVSNYGEIRALTYSNQYGTFIKIKKLKSNVNHKGYLQVSLGYKPRKSITVHRLVAQAFIPNPNNLLQVNHKNGNKLDNRVNNLEWCDNNYNMNHAKEHGLLEKRRKKIMKPINQYDLQGNFIKKWDCIKSAENLLKNNHIHECCKGYRKTASGYIWRYADEN